LNGVIKAVIEPLNILPSPRPSRVLLTQFTPGPGFNYGLNQRVSARGEHIGRALNLQVAGKPGDSPEMQFEKSFLNDYNISGIYLGLIRA
jgi:hypothetical protein